MKCFLKKLIQQKHEIQWLELFVVFIYLIEVNIQKIVPMINRSFLSLLVLGVCAHSSNAHAQSLRESLVMALENHPSVESAMAAVDISNQERREEFSGYFPEVSINANAGRIFGDNSTTRGLSVTRGEAYSFTSEASINVRQMIFDGLETTSRVGAAKARRQSANVDVLDVREQLSFVTVQAYINVVRSRKALAMIARHAERVDDYMNRIKTMVDEGAADEAELQQAKDIRVILDGIQADFEGQVSAAEAQYYEATGQFPDENLQDPVPFGLDELKEAAADIDSIVETHPSVVSAHYGTHAAEHDINAERGTLFPDLDGELSYLKSDKKDVIGGELVDAKALVRLSWNFSTGGADLARLKRTKFAHKESIAQLKELERQIERDVRLALSELETSEKQLDLLGQRQSLNAELFKTYESQFEAARINILQLMQAHNQLFNTKLETMNGRYRFVTAQYGVLASMGQLQNKMNIAIPKYIQR